MRSGGAWKSVFETVSESWQNGRFGVSDSVDLGQAEFANYNDRGITLSLVNGFRNTISVGPELNNGDYCRPIGSYVVPIPSSIEVRAEGGTPV